MATTAVCHDDVDIWASDRRADCSKRSWTCHVYYAAFDLFPGRAWRLEQRCAHGPPCPFEESLYNLTPLITITYSASSPGLDLASLQVLVNGAD